MKLEFINKQNFNKIIKELKDLYKVCFNKEISEEYFSWIYLNNPIDDFIFCLATEDDKIIGCYSVIPINIVINNEIIRSGISMPLLIKSEFKNKGLSTKIGIKVYEELKRKKYDFILGFPDEVNHHNLVKKFGFENIYEIPTLKLVVKDKDIYHINRCDIQKIDIDNDFTFDYSLLINKKDSKIKVYKDLNYLKWMFKKNKIYEYKNYVISRNKVVLASLIMTKYNDKIEIVELNSVDKQYNKILLCKIFKDVAEENIKSINICCSVYNREHIILEELGFENSTPINYFIIKKINNLSSDIINFKNWDIQISDFKYIYLNTL
ncbi:hypothetical protein SDC9_57573 [bioreactor metagenome]|uniref:N-acetyltransferase domain-containing protein n=1 Tax=bioreactor metagenome TaxID=1076179 RepID=A0A644XAR9_9ZZZZ